MMIFIATYDHTFVWFSLIFMTSFIWRHHIWGFNRFLFGSMGLWVFVLGFSPTNKVPISLGCIGTLIFSHYFANYIFGHINSPNRVSTLTYTYLLKYTVWLPSSSHVIHGSQKKFSKSKNRSKIWSRKFRKITDKETFFVVLGASRYSK